MADEDAELQMALMLSLQQSDENTDPAGGLPSTGAAAAGGSCSLLARGSPMAAAEDDDDTPVGRNVMPADSPHLQAPQKNNKRRAEISSAAAQPVQMKLPKAAKLTDESADAAQVFRQAVARRWGSYLVQIGERELAAACADARRTSRQPMSPAERAACLAACRELLSSGNLPSSPTGLQYQRQLAHLCGADGAAQLEALLQPSPAIAAEAAPVAAPAEPAQPAEPDPRDFALSEAELGEEVRKEEAKQQAAAARVACAPAAAAAAPAAAAAAPAGDKPDQSKKKPKKRNRCEQCRKKVGLLGFECKCGGVFCGAHRMASTHCCTFEAQRKAEQKARLQKSLDSAAANIDVEHRFEKI